MKLLILGGTRFIGRHLAEHALAAGHEVTLFNRNQVSHGLFPNYTPGTIRLSAERLRDAVGHYTFISTVSVYRDFARQVISEDAPVGIISDQDVETAENAVRSGGSIGSEAYGPLKAR